MSHVHKQMHLGRSPPEIGRALGSESRDVLCLDEMQITDIADAAIVSRTLDGIFSSGAALVTTSNRPPHELYAGGLNRHVYIPALCATLDDHRVVTHRLAAACGDYREVRARASRPTPGDAPELAAPRLHRSRSAALGTALERLGGRLVPQPPLTLGRGRTLSIARANEGGCVLLSFSELCESPLAAADYMALARRFRVLGIDGVCALGVESHNSARRLITLIDVWYDRGLELHLASTVELDRLFEGLGSAADVTVTDGAAACSQGRASAARPPTSAAASVRGVGGASAGLSSTWMADGTEWSATGRMGVSLAGMAGIQEAAFAQRRCVSRLREMCFSDAWPPREAQAAESRIHAGDPRAMVQRENA